MAAAVGFPSRVDKVLFAPFMAATSLSAYTASDSKCTRVAARVGAYALVVIQAFVSGVVLPFALVVWTFDSLYQTLIQGHNIRFSNASMRLRAIGVCMISPLVFLVRPAALDDLSGNTQYAIQTISRLQDSAWHAYRNRARLNPLQLELELRDAIPPGERRPPILSYIEFFRTISAQSPETVANFPIHLYFEILSNR